MWKLKVLIFSFMVFLLSFCSTPKEGGLTKIYSDANTDVVMYIHKLDYKLPDLIEAHLSITHPEDQLIDVSLHKKYKDDFVLESFHKTNKTGNLPHLVVHDYSFTFSSLRPGKITLPAFTINIHESGRRRCIKTDAANLSVKSTLTQNDSDLRPIIENITSEISLISWPSLLLVIIVGVILFLKQKK